ALRGRHLGRLPPRGDPAVEERREAEAPRAHRRDVAARGAPQISQAAEAHRVRTQGCSDRGMRVTELLESIRTGIGGLPAHGKGALLLLLLYAVQSEIRFGAKARSGIPGATDRWSTLAVSLSAAVPVVGFVLAMKGRIASDMPGMPAIAWVGVGLGALGLLLRLWALLVLRERYTRTLLVHG